MEIQSEKHELGEGHGNTFFESGTFTNGWMEERAINRILGLGKCVCVLGGR